MQGFFCDEQFQHVRTSALQVWNALRQIASACWVWNLTKAICHIYASAQSIEGERSTNGSAMDGFQPGDPIFITAN
jgi:hypothetical protein